MKKILVVVALLLGAVHVCHAGTYYANSCSYADVNDCINGSGVNTCHAGSPSGSQGTHKAVNGDTINIPAGSCTWSSTLAISGVCIDLLGSGTPNSGAGTTGAGTINTTLLDDVSGNPMIEVEKVPQSGCGTFSQYMRISTLEIEPDNSSIALYSPITVAGTCTSSGCPYLRIDNIEFAWGSNTHTTWLTRTDNIWGVYDHNTTNGASPGNALGMPHYSAWEGIGSNGDESWASPTTFGTPEAMYFENNSLGGGLGTTEDCDEPTPGGNAGGCRAAIRFNSYPSLNGSIGYFHGTDTTQRTRGGYQMEIYGNTATCTNSSQGCSQAIMDFRSGTGFIFGNIVDADSGSWLGSLVDVDTQRRYRDISTEWGECNGATPYDTNDGGTDPTGTFTGITGATTLIDSAVDWTTNEWVDPGSPYELSDVTQGGSAMNALPMEIASNTVDTATPYNIEGWSWDSGDSFQLLHPSVCVDQPGRTLSIYYSGTTPSPVSPADETLTPIYEWDDTGTKPNQGNFGSTTQSLIANRDWYTDNSNGASKAQTSPTSPFNGSGGVGFGTLANRPTACTAGVGYFATDEGNWNQSGNGFGQGEMYICTATNTWTEEYEPYTYPHPLDGGDSTSDGSHPAPPTNLVATPVPVG